MLEALFLRLAAEKVPPVPSLKTHEGTTQAASFLEVPPVPPVPSLKTISEAENKLQQNIRERIEERAAIQEYDGGLSRADAEQAATSSIRVYCYRTTEKPKAELVAIMPGLSLEEAQRSLALRYGARLLEVYAMPGNPYTKH